MILAKHLSWENFRATVFLRGQQRVHRVHGSPVIEFFGDGVTNRIGIWLEIPKETAIPLELSRLARIKTSTFDTQGHSRLEVATDSSALHRQFYHFMVAVAERVLGDNRSPADAVALELRCFEELLQEKPLLGVERQLGLLGELLFLKYLAEKSGISLLDAWVGPTGEPHDFRTGTREFEVKTTVAPHRIHVIHGAEQLVASRDCSLALISVLLGPPGASRGFSLADTVEAMSRVFRPAPGRLDQFKSGLELSGFREADIDHYTRRFTMRRPLGLVMVDERFPAITRPVIQRAMGDLAQRVEGLQYEVNIEGLESEEGSQEFGAWTLV